MTFAKVGFVLVPAAWLFLVTAAPEAAQSKSVVDGVFTEAQATRGNEVYQRECSSCHGEGLGGDGFAPALAGTEFLGNWNGTTVGDLYDRIRISMPPSNPSSVNAQAKADIIAHVFKANKYPAGKEELTPDTLKPIKIELPK
ncbi:MAG: cytochrome c [Vicinamibacterales bacterium]